MTTVHDFAYFVWYYLKTWPKAIDQYHSVRSFTWPRQAGQKSITQHNGNKLLTSYPGADGLKTGYIDESGYNLACTAQREGMRLIGVILGGMSDSLRFWDSREILDYGFEQYRRIDLPLLEARPVRVWRGESQQVTVGGGTASAVLPASMVKGLKSRLSQLAEIEAPVAPGHILAWTEFLDAKGKKVLRFPMRVAKPILAADPLTGFAEGAYLWLRSLFGHQWPGSGANTVAALATGES
jgi:D-alanyl-D-alanine carboxypeptidase (penicillin-binding protein 5/6)